MKPHTHRRILVGFRLVEALGQVLSGMGAYVKQRQLNWQFHCVDADEFLANLRPGTIDGAVTVISPRSRGEISRIRRSGVPVVNLLHDLHPTLPSVLSDDVSIGRLAAQYLLKRGFRNIAFFGFDTLWSRDRQRGFEQALDEAGVKCHVCKYFADIPDYRLLTTSRAMKRLNRWIVGLPKPVAVLACSDLMGRSILTTCESANLRVPQEVAILGVDNLVPTCELASVPLSSVPQDFKTLGFEAARVLDRSMSKNPPPNPVLVPPSGVVARRSTDVLAFEDQYISSAMRLIHDRSADGITMTELLQEVPVSRRWLDARFKAVVGHTPSDEIRSLRTERIKDLLLHTDLSIKQIAMRCGFSCPENMFRFFKRETGLTPRGFRERQARMG